MKLTKRYIRKTIQEMARPRLKFAVKVERLADAVIDLMMAYEKSERAADPDWRSSVELSPERKLFHEADQALTTLAEVLKESGK